MLRTPETLDSNAKNKETSRKKCVDSTIQHEYPPAMPIPVTDEILSIIFELKEQGQEFTPQEVWIMLECKENPKTINQLANKADVSRQAVDRHITTLKAKKMLTWIEVAKEFYYRCPYDLTNPKSTTISLLIKAKRVTFEDLIGYLSYRYLERIQYFTLQAMCHLHFRLMKASQGEQLPEPSPVDTQLFLKAMHDELLQYAALINQIAELDVWDDHPRTLERLTEPVDEHTTEVIKWYNMKFQQNWAEKVLSRKGLGANAFWEVKNLIEVGHMENPWENR